MSKAHHLENIATAEEEAMVEASTEEDVAYEEGALSLVSPPNPANNTRVFSASHTRSLDT